MHLLKESESTRISYSEILTNTHYIQWLKIYLMMYLKKSKSDEHHSFVFMGYKFKYSEVM